MDELISVIIPVYNVRNYLGECLTSVMGQTYPWLEIILVDDGSTDGSGEICEEYARQDGRVKVIHQENAGLSAARNAGLDIAAGKYFVFVDSDDLVHVKMIEYLYCALAFHQGDVSICSHLKFKESGEIQNIQEDCLGDSLNKGEGQEIPVQVYTGKECIRMFYSQLCVDMVVVWNKLFSRDFFGSVRFPLGRKYEDEFVNYKILYPMKKCIYLPCTLYYYRARENSITQERFNLGALDRLDALAERKDYFRKLGEGELCALAARKYAAVIADAMSQITKFYPEEKELLRRLNREFRQLYWEELVCGRYIKKADKIKYGLFIINRHLYWFLKKIYMEMGKGSEKWI